MKYEHSDILWDQTTNEKEQKGGWQNSVIHFFFGIYISYKS